jgi:hypothetical protein
MEEMKIMFSLQKILRARDNGSFSVVCPSERVCYLLVSALGFSVAPFSLRSDKIIPAL